MRQISILLAVLLAATLGVACDPGEDKDGDGSGSDVGGRRDGSTSDVGFDTGGPDVPGAGNLACHLDFDELQDEACLECMQGSCSAALTDALGTNGFPTEPGGACVDLLTCLDNCSCEDNQCAIACFGGISGACQDAVEVAQSCQGESCGEACEEGGGPGGDVCSEPVGTLSFGSTITGVLGEGDAEGGPREAFYDVYSVEADGGVVSVESDEFDTYLYAYSEACSETGSDDDGGSGTNSQLTVPGSTAFIMVTGFSSGEAGTYTISVLTPPL